MMWISQHKKVIVFLLFFVGFFIVLVSMVLINRREIKPVEVKPGPTPTYSARRLEVVSSNPKNGDVVQINTQNLQLTFSQPIQGKALRTQLTEKNAPGEIAVENTQNGPILNVRILRPLAPETEYILNVRVADNSVLSYTLQFSTQKGNAIDTYPNGLPEAVNEDDRVNRPDIYIANKLPYGNGVFVMRRSINEAGDIVFTVTGKGTTESLKKAVDAWFDEISVPTEKRSGLQIQYLPQ